MKNVDDESETETKINIIKRLFHDVMHCPQEIIEIQINKLISRISSKSEVFDRETKRPKLETNDHDIQRVSQVICHLNKDYPGDIGVLMPTILNYMDLAPGTCNRVIAWWSMHVHTCIYNTHHHIVVQVKDSSWDRMNHMRTCQGTAWKRWRYPIMWSGQG